MSAKSSAERSSPVRRSSTKILFLDQGQYAANIPLVMAVLSLSALPLVLVYVAAQERVTAGMLAGAIKG